MTDWRDNESVIDKKVKSLILAKMEGCAVF